ncbi:Uncharacterised protein r2_g2301 [Pycnogonum litorale]
MPFGLASAPQTFVRLMTKVTAGLSNVECYLDDCIIFSKTLREHIVHVERVLQAISVAGLKLRKEKCDFFKLSLPFLGFIVGNNTIKPLPSKIKIMQDYPEPTSWKELHRFLGMCSYYRTLIKDFGTIAGVLYRLGRKNTPFIWNSECKEAFEKLKLAMSSSPVISMPDLEKIFIVKTDASQVGVGAILQQQTADGQRNIIEYAGFSFNETQRKYSVIEQEATGILYALNKWQHYLLGRHFMLETDHRPLMWIKSKKDCRGKLRRMALRLAEFDKMEVRHIRGTENSDADAISRIHELSSCCDDKFQAQQRREFKELLAKQRYQFTEKNGFLYYTEDDQERICVPQEYVKEILKKCHDEQGHLGIDRTLDLIRRRFYWPKLRDDVKNWIKRCRNCATKKDTLQDHSIAPLKPTDLVAIEPFQKLGIDIMGPLPESNNMNKYVIVLQDYFTKWIEAVAINACTTEDIIKWLKDEVFGRFGIPVELICDQGPQFDSKLFKLFCEELGVKISYITPYHHQSNGMIERLNRSLLNMLRMYIDSDQKDWDEYLGPVLFAYRTSVHSVTKVSPFEAVQMRTPRLPIDLKYPTSLENQEQIVRRMSETRKRMRNNLMKAAENRKNLYDEKNRVVEPSFKVDDKVYYKRKLMKRGFAPKLMRNWCGPFRIVNQESDTNFKIAGKDGNSVVVHSNLLKRCQDSAQELEIVRGRGRPPKEKFTS